MKKIRIFETNEKEESKSIFALCIKRLLKKLNLYKIIIYSNMIIIYILLSSLYKKNKKKTNEEKFNIQKSKYSDIIYSNEEKLYYSLTNKFKRETIIWPLPKEIKFKPAMSDKEIIIFSYFMKKENIYFEFGSGGSTNIASYYKLKSYSVESDIKWHEKLKKSGVITNYITINLKSNNLGYPGNDTKIVDWKKYIQAYKPEYNADIILIDGRFRVACAFDIFPKIRNDTLIFIHDYEQRKEYHVIEKFYQKLKSWDSLAVFLKKPNYNSIPTNLYNFYMKEKVI